MVFMRILLRKSLVNTAEWCVSMINVSSCIFLTTRSMRARVEGSSEFWAKCMGIHLTLASDSSYSWVYLCARSFSVCEKDKKLNWHHMIYLYFNTPPGFWTILIKLWIPSAHNCTLFEWPLLLCHFRSVNRDYYLFLHIHHSPLEECAWKEQDIRVVYRQPYLYCIK